MTNLMRKYLDEVYYIDGIFAEFGVFRGDTFKQLIVEADGQERYIIGVDSFCGMDEPVEQDGGYYPKGKLNSRGYDKLRNDLSKSGYTWEIDYLLFKGFVPKVLKKIPINDYNGFCFVYIDLDQYKPTKETFEFIFPQVNSGGLILFDDYIEKYDILASLAIKEILEEYKGQYKIEEKNIRLIDGGCKTQLLIRKL